MSEQPVFRPESKFCRIRIGRSLLFSRQETFAQRPQRGGVLLIPGLDATFAARGRPDWMAVTKDAVWVASSSVNHVVRLDAKTNQPGTIVTVAKPCAGLWCWASAAFGFRVVATTRSSALMQRRVSTCGQGIKMLAEAFQCQVRKRNDSRLQRSSKMKTFSPGRRISLIIWDPMG